MFDANFVMKGYGPGELNKYWCSHCKQDGIEHEVVNIPGPSTNQHSSWGAGLPTTMRQCTTCKREDGPWVSAALVGGGY